MKGRRTACLELAHDALARTRRRRWAQLQVGEGSLQVEASAADQDRAAPFGKRGIDLGVRQRRELSCGEGLRDRHKREQPMLEPLALLRGRGTRQDFEPAVHLEGIRRDCDGVLPTPAQPLGYLDRNGGLADSRGAEDRDQGVGGRHDR